MLRFYWVFLLVFIMWKLPFSSLNFLYLNFFSNCLCKSFSCFYILLILLKKLLWDNWLAGRKMIKKPKSCARKFEQGQDIRQYCAGSKDFLYSFWIIFYPSFQNFGSRGLDGLSFPKKPLFYHFLSKCLVRISMHTLSFFNRNSIFTIFV